MGEPKLSYLLTSS